MGEVAQLMGPDIEAHGSPVLKAIFAEYFRQFPPFEGAEQLKAMAQRTHYARAWSLFLERYPLVTHTVPATSVLRTQSRCRRAGRSARCAGRRLLFLREDFPRPAGGQIFRAAILADPAPQGPQPDRCADRRAALARGSDRRCQWRQIEARWGGVSEQLWERMAQV